MAASTTADTTSLVAEAIRRTDSLLATIPSDFGGGCGTVKCHYMARTIIERNLKKCVEIGVWHGRSLAPAAVATQLLGGSTIGIDPYSAECMAEADAPAIVMQRLPAFIDNTNFEMVYNAVRARFAPYDHVKLIRLPAEKAVGEVDTIDCLHIDGNHDTALVTLDIELYAPKVVSGGLIIMDDTDWDSVKVTLPLLDKFGVKIHEAVGWAVWQKS